MVKVGDYVLAEVDGELHLGKVERASPEPALENGERRTENGGRRTEESALPESKSGPEPAPGVLSSALTEQDRPKAGMPTIFRPATGEDLVRDQENRELARKAFEFCRQCIQERGLDMKLVNVVVLFDGSKILFFFTATNRIDFRELVKDLVRVFRTRIELRQIGARHETQMVGGIGNCGQLICCQRFLRQFAPSTIKMAKEQNLFLNPAKISGVCNRLLCCLSYEQGNYEEFLAQCPKVGKKFSTALGSAKILRANYFRRTLSVWLESGGEREIDLDEWFKILTPGELKPPVRPAAQVQPLVLDSPGSRLPPKLETAPEQPVHSAPKVQAPQASPIASFQGNGSDRGEKSAVEAQQAKAAGEKDPGKKKRKGRSGSRKSKRRSRPSRG